MFRVTFTEFINRFLVYPFYGMLLSIGAMIIVAILHSAVKKRKPKRKTFLGKIEWFLDDFKAFIEKIGNFLLATFLIGLIGFGLYDFIRGLFK